METPKLTKNWEFAQAVFFRSLMALAFLGLVSGFAFDGLRLTEVSGRVEIHRPGINRIEMARAGDHIGHNEKVVVGQKARIQGGFPDGTRFILEEDSKILVNFSGPEQDTLPPHKILTLFHGSLYLSVEKPLKNYAGQFTKVFAGPVSLLTREGSLIAQKGRAPNDLEIGLLAGQYQIFNSTDSREIFLKGGVGFRLDTAGALEETWQIDPEYYSYGIPWLDSKIIQKDIHWGYLMEKRDQDVISGKRLGKAVVVEFPFTGKGLENWEIGKFFTDLVARELADVSHREFVLLPESDKGPEEIADENAADRIVVGKLEKFDFHKKAILNESTQKYELHLEVEIRLNVQVYGEGGKKLLRNAAFNGVIAGEKEEAFQLGDYLEAPLSPDNKIFAAPTFLKIINSLKKRIRQFARAAV